MCFFPQRLKRRFHIVLLPNAVAEISLALFHAPEVESEGAVALILIGMGNRPDHVVVHCSTVERVRMGNNCPLFDMGLLQHAFYFQPVCLKENPFLLHMNNLVS
jgi:hypothetical protein